MIKCVLFDLDGTLLSTLDTITYHLNNTLSAFSLREISVNDCSEFIGNGARKLVERAVAKSGVGDEGTVRRVLEVYNDAYNSDPIPHTEPYDGVVDLVEELYGRGIKLGVITNKPEPTAIKLIDSFFPDRFDLVSGGREGAVLKPDPKEALAVLEKLGAHASECAFVGDTSVDIKTGINMGAGLTVGVSWGFRSREELAGAGADIVVDTPNDILRAVAEVL